MLLLSHRFEYADNYTVSRLYINGTYECYVLEDKVRAPGVKVPSETAIPAGTYKVVINHSEHFDKNLPQILDVPMFEGIRIHSGNTDLDTEGCLLVGDLWNGGDNISNSRVAFDRLFPKLQAAIAAGQDITITVEDTNT